MDSSTNPNLNPNPVTLKRKTISKDESCDQPEIQTEPETQKRKTIHEDDYFMSIAYIASLRSKDPNTRVGACIVNRENRILGVGYNCMPNGCPDGQFPWKRKSSDPMETKHQYVCHAEMNAILNSNGLNCKQCTIFSTLFPCNECAKMIIQSGIERVVYLYDKNPQDPKFKSSRLMLETANIKITQHQPEQSKIVIDFDEIKKNYGSS